MAEVRVKERLEVPAERLWALVADFGDVSWMPGGGVNVAVEGAGPGMTRTIAMGERRIRERLESRDDARRTLVYTIPEGVPFPVKDYRATMEVGEEDGASSLDWSCHFVPDGVPESQVAAQIEGLYRTMIGWIGERLGAPKAAAGG